MPSRRQVDRMGLADPGPVIRHGRRAAGRVQRLLHRFDDPLLPEADETQRHAARLAFSGGMKSRGGHQGDRHDQQQP